VYRERRFLCDPSSPDHARELERRNYAQTTIDCYIHASNISPGIFTVPPIRLGPEHIHEYQAALFKKWKLAPNTVNQRLAALRFFYIQTLKKAWSVAETPYPKKTSCLPMILSQEEVARLIDSRPDPLSSHRTHDGVHPWQSLPETATRKNLPSV
jgi:integrase/recombinase XerD